MHKRTEIVGTLLLVSMLSACATYPADRILRFTDIETDLNQSKIIGRTERAVIALLDHLNLPDDRRAAFKKVSLDRVARIENAYASLGSIDRTVVLANGDVDISSASNSVIVAKGVVHVSFSSNNVVVSADHIDISHDGNYDGGGSLLVAKGRIRISHATGTIVSSRKGLDISHARGVVAYNTPTSKTAWGRIDSIIGKPLFADDPSAATTVAPASSAMIVNEGKLVNDHPKWPDAEVHMACLRKSPVRNVVVEVPKTKKPVILVVCAYEKTVWEIRPHEGAEILQVIASGYHRQQVEGATFPVATYSYDESSPLFFYPLSSTMLIDPNIIARVRELTGKEITSYQGRDNYDRNRPFVIKAE